MSRNLIVFCSVREKTEKKQKINSVIRLFLTYHNFHTFLQIRNSAVCSRRLARSNIEYFATLSTRSILYLGICDSPIFSYFRPLFPHCPFRAQQQIKREKQILLAHLPRSTMSPYSGHRNCRAAHTHTHSHKGKRYCFAFESS